VDQAQPGKRRYRVLRVPQSVVERLYLHEAAQAWLDMSMASACAGTEGRFAN
jgi:hypothetical protein